MTATGISVRTITTPSEREAAFDVRRRVFQEEQGVSAEEEFDDDDDRALHALALVGDTPAGTGRILFQPGYAKIGRMAVLKAWRRHGIGRAVLNHLIALARARGVGHFVLHAQVHAIPFYAAAGFTVAGDEFQEAGIPHRRMERTFTG